MRRIEGSPSILHSVRRGGFFAYAQNDTVLEAAVVGEALEPPAGKCRHFPDLRSKYCHRIVCTIVICKANHREGQDPPLQTRGHNSSHLYKKAKKNLHISVEVFVFALPIFPGSRPPSIVGVHELNFCVRDGNRWTLMTINTNYSVDVP